MSSLDRLPARHDLVWLDETRWRDALLAPVPDTWLPALTRWFSLGRPAVVRRQESALACALGLGVALPPAQGKLRISLIIDRRAVRKTSGPVTLAAALPSAPPEWWTGLEALLDAARSLGIEFRVYGSVAWQHLTGEPYLTRSSDVDLLWSAMDGAVVQKGLDMLVHWQRLSGLQADGELLLPGGAAVAWRELLPAPRRVLVKRPHGVELRATDEVLSGLRAGPC